MIQYLLELMVTKWQAPKIVDDTTMNRQSAPQ